MSCSSALSRLNPQPLGPVRNCFKKVTMATCTDAVLELAVLDPSATAMERSEGTLPRMQSEKLSVDIVGYRGQRRERYVLHLRAGWDIIGSVGDIHYGDNTVIAAITATTRISSHGSGSQVHHYEGKCGIISGDFCKEEMKVAK